MSNDFFVFMWLSAATLGTLAMIFGLRYMSNKERMAMIEKGMDLSARPQRPRPAPFRNLKWGLLATGAGLGLFVAYLMDNFMLFRVGHDAFQNGNITDYHANGGNVPIYFALIVVGGGLGLILSYRIEKKEFLDKP